MFDVESLLADIQAPEDHTQTHGTHPKPITNAQNTAMLMLMLMSIMLLFVFFSVCVLLTSPPDELCFQCADQSLTKD